MYQPDLDPSGNEIKKTCPTSQRKVMWFYFGSVSVHCTARRSSFKTQKGDQKYTLKRIRTCLILFNASTARRRVSRLRLAQQGVQKYSFKKPHFRLNYEIQNTG
jgi:hypothetical protein